MHRHLLPALLSFIFLLSTFTTAHAASYAFITLDVPFPDASNTTALGINNRSQIVGGYSDSSGVQGFLDNRGLITAIPHTTAEDINDQQQIVGFYSDRNGTHGFLFDRSGFTPLDVPDATLTDAIGINNRTQIVGSYRDVNEVFHGYLYKGGTFSTIDVSFPSTLTAAFGINMRGQIVGIYDDATGRHGFLYSGGLFTPIVVPFPGGAVFTQPFGINDHGQIVGSYSDGDRLHGFLYKHGVFSSIDVPQSSSTEVNRIDNSGQIVGRYVESSGVAHGFVATPSHEEKDND